jgi:hypothetical protein
MIGLSGAERFRALKMMLGEAYLRPGTLIDRVMYCNHGAHVLGLRLPPLRTVEAVKPPVRWCGQHSNTRWRRRVCQCSQPERTPAMRGTMAPHWVHRHTAACLSPALLCTSGCWMRVRAEAGVGLFSQTADSDPASEDSKRPL